MANQHFDSMSVGVLDFKSESLECLTLLEGEETEREVFFDLASLTKPLVLGTAWLSQEKNLNDDFIKLVEHRAGLPAFARLEKKTWRETVSQFKINDSETSYSDLSALRAQLVFEDLLGRKIYDEVEPFFDDRLFHWLDLPYELEVRPTGFRNGSVIRGEVHDPNAYIIGEKVSHAGLFGSVNSLSKTLFGLNKKLDLIGRIITLKTKEEAARFCRAFDFVTNPEETLAGKGATSQTFGHLGFTGTMFWICPDQQKGYVLLTNATQNYWYARGGLKTLRQELGKLIWSL